MRAEDWISLSPSSISVIADCGRCGWRHFRGVQRPRGIFPSLPGGIDLVVKRELDKHRGRGEWPPLFRDLKLPGKPVPESPRKRLRFEDAALKIRLVGLLDDACEVEGQVGPLDIKTRASRANEVHEAYRRQMTLYHLLLAANGWKPTGIALLIYLFPVEGGADGGICFGTDLKEVKTREDEARKILKTCAEVLRGPMPAPSSGCEWCGWADDVAALEKDPSQVKGRHDHDAGENLEGAWVETSRAGRRSRGAASAR